MSRSTDPFLGTAEYYAHYRPSLPLELVERLSGVVKPVRGGTLLDLGTGIGQMAVALCPYFEDIIAIDQNETMVRLARRELVQVAGGGRIRVLRGQAESVRLPRGWLADAVTIGHAFLWMDKGAVLGHIEPHVSAQGIVAVYDVPNIWDGRMPWQQAIERTIQDFLGEEGRVGAGLYRRPTQSFREALEASAFRQVQEVRIPFRRTWKGETILSVLYSSSFSARQLYGERVREFAAAIRAALDMTGRKVFVEEAAVTLVLGRRSSAEA